MSEITLKIDIDNLKSEVATINESIIKSHKRLDEIHTYLNAVEVIMVGYEDMTLSHTLAQKTLTPSVATSIVESSKADNKKGKYYDHIKFDFPDSEIYSKNYQQPVKIYFALRELKTGFVEDIVSKIIQKEPGLIFNEVFIWTRNIASKLLSDGIIGAEKFGKKNKYFIMERKEYK